MRNTTMTAAATAAVLFLIVRDANATTLRVPADYPTIQSAINAAQGGDTVLVADGTYTGDGNRDLDFKGKAIKLLSRSGANNCVIDCGGTSDGAHRGIAFHSHEGQKSLVLGFTIRGGSIGSGAGIAIDDGSPTIRYCKFIDNNATSHGGAIFISGDGAPIITHCVFAHNHADGDGGAINMAHTSPYVYGCRFEDNSAGDSAGSVSVFEASPTITDCVFRRNTARFAADISANASHVDVTGCTFYEPSGTSIRAISGATVTVNDTIAIGLSTPALVEDGGTLHVSYSDITGGYEGTGNIDADPHFVSADAGDLHLQPGSPCTGAGIANSANKSDLDRSRRPDPPSMGAYEPAGADVPPPTASTAPVQPTLPARSSRKPTYRIVKRIVVNGLVSGPDGCVYGTTSGGGAYGWGSVFKINQDGQFVTIHSFKGDRDDASRECEPNGALAVAKDGTIYGITSVGGSPRQRGVFDPFELPAMFMISPKGTYSVIYRFHIGDLESDDPNSLIVGRDGCLYGTSGRSGGSGLQSALVYKFNRSGHFVTVHGFAHDPGYPHPDGGLVIGADGAFYGVAHSAAYRVTSSGLFMDLCHIHEGQSELTPGHDGDLLGVDGGGNDNAGCLMSISPLGNTRVVYQFNDTEGGHPDSPVAVDQDGNVYGTLSRPSRCVYQLTPDGTLTKLHTFSLFDNNGVPSGMRLVAGAHGRIYGATPTYPLSSGVLYCLDPND